MTKRFSLPLLAGTALILSACGNDAADDLAAENAMAAEETNTIVDVASNHPDYSTLVTAIEAAGLVDTLNGPGPFTVFVPTNAAFDKLPEGTVETLTTTDTEQLSSILTYHVVSGEVMAADLFSAIQEAGDEGYTITTLNGGTLTAMLVDGAVHLMDAGGNAAIVTMTNVDADNGVIHVIDTVLMPE